ncbi:hypothetical protein S1361_03295 [Streptomyces cyanogenus]|uniref:Uncharacterized protein n=1 Tax=Streptomyces cyanogenus TaxID=80860 RepID=A0ABX7TIG3_STRCY|nr:hypothetical protein S1361_03295 [Streptomyces cyanogenus]
MVCPGEVVPRPGGVVPFPGEVVVFPGVVVVFPGAVGVVPSVAVDSVNGSWPVLLAASRKTSPRAVDPPPPGWVKNTPRTTAATRAAVSAATRGTDFHQGPCGSLPP